MTLTNDGNGTATLSGKSIAVGTYTFTLVANNSESPEASELFTLTVVA